MRFLHSFSRYLQFILGDKPVENSLGEDSYGDRPTLPFVCTQGCNCNPVLPGLAAPFASPVECAGGSDRAPSALVDDLLHGPVVSAEAQQDHA